MQTSSFREPACLSSVRHGLQMVRVRLEHHAIALQNETAAISGVNKDERRSESRREFPDAVDAVSGEILCYR